MGNILTNEKGEPYCDTCGQLLGQRIDDTRVICSSSYIDGCSTCYECMIEHCLSTNCLACDKGNYPDCEHVSLKEYYRYEDGSPVIVNLSYGKDSLAAIHVAIDILGWNVVRIVHAEVWATDTIPGDSPDMVEFKKRVDAYILRRWGVAVEHFRSKDTFESFFFDTIKYKTERSREDRTGQIHGWPYLKGSWCLRQLKLAALDKVQRETKGCTVAIGIAIDEPDRFHNLVGGRISPLVAAGWTEKMCMKWCEDNDLVSPDYHHSDRSGCWFCPKQRLEQLRHLRHNHPELWAKMLEWDPHSPVTFKPDKHTVADYDARFTAEDAGLVPIGSKFRWSMLPK